MHHIQTQHSDGWVILECNMHLVHIRSDYRQLLVVLPEHPHTRNSALASSRELSMQDFVLLWRSFAGRCYFLQFTCRRHARFVTQLVVDCAYACLRLSGRQSKTTWVTYLAWAGTLTAACAYVCQTLGSFVALQIARAICMLIRSSQVCLGQTLFPRSAHLGMFLTRSAASAFGKAVLLSHLGMLILPLRTKVCAERLAFAC